MSKIDGFLNQAYFARNIIPGEVMEVSGKTGVIIEILKCEEPQICEFALGCDNGKVYKIRFNGHMYHITEEMPPQPGV